MSSRAGHDAEQDLEREEAYVDSERPAADTGGLDPEAHADHPDDHQGLTGAASGGTDAERHVGLAGTNDDPQTHPAADEAVEEELIRENAETSLDQPSDSVE